MNKPKLSRHDFGLESEKLDQLILEKFTASFMSNSKWEKLMEALLKAVDQLHVTYKIVYSDEVIKTAFSTPDTPFFEEPTLYKEVEWMEIPRFCENLFAVNGRAEKKVLEQDLILIEKAINDVGKFNTNVALDALRIYAYT